MFNLFYSVLYGVACAILWVVSPFSKKIRAGLFGRLGLADRIRSQCSHWDLRPLWFHVASSGELEQCLPILDELKRVRPETKVFLSFFSPTAKNALALEVTRRHLSGLSVPWDYADYMPFDFSASTRSVLSILSPTHFVMINREIWPNLLKECQARNIRCFLMATYFSNKAVRWLPLYRKVLGTFDYIGVSHQVTADQLNKLLSGPRIETVGDPRVERVLMRRNFRKTASWKKHFDGQNVMVFGNLWMKDFSRVRSLVQNLIQREVGSDWRVILAPHEPSAAFVRQLARSLQRTTPNVALWSVWLKAPDTKSHLILDRVGELAELYDVAQMVFVGGSFQARVHNVLEPAAYGKPIFTGPYIDNSGEALEMARNGLGLVRTENEEELKREVLKLVSNPLLTLERSRSLSKYLESRTGSSKQYVRALLN